MVGELVRKMAGQLGAQRVDEMGADLVALSVVLLAVDLVDDLAGGTVERTVRAREGSVVDCVEGRVNG